MAGPWRGRTSADSGRQPRPAGGQFATGRAGGPLGAGKRLSDRTPLRTKLITAVLALVIMALAAISVASVYMLRAYLTTAARHRSSRRSSRASSLAGHCVPGRPRRTPPTQSGQRVLAGVQQPGQPAQPGRRQRHRPRRRHAAHRRRRCPALPTSASWATANSPAAADRRAPSPAPTPGGSSPDRHRHHRRIGSSQTGTLVVGVRPRQHQRADDPAADHRSTLIVGGAIIVVLAVVGVGVVRANLRPLERHRADRRPDRRRATSTTGCPRATRAPRSGRSAGR